MSTSHARHGPDVVNVKDESLFECVYICKLRPANIKEEQYPGFFKEAKLYNCFSHNLVAKLIKSISEIEKWLQLFPSLLWWGAFSVVPEAGKTAVGETFAVLRDPQGPSHLRKRQRSGEESLDVIVMATTIPYILLAPVGMYICIRLDPPARLSASATRLEASHKQMRIPNMPHLLLTALNSTAPNFDFLFSNCLSRAA